jgi:hypothetical protein
MSFNNVPNKHGIMRLGVEERPRHLPYLVKDVEVR